MVFKPQVWIKKEDGKSPHSVVALRQIMNREQFMPLYIHLPTFLMDFCIFSMPVRWRNRGTDALTFSRLYWALVADLGIPVGFLGDCYGECAA